MSALDISASQRFSLTLDPSLVLERMILSRLVGAQAQARSRLAAFVAGPGLSRGGSVAAARTPKWQGRRGTC